jgi:hypothetical protein
MAVDPRTAISGLTDAVPFLLFPIRLETRFAPGKRELWVRVYPDDCLVETFDPELTAEEASNAREYWTSVWLARGDVDLERSAWRNLASAHGSARAGWIVDSYQPVNADQKPTVDSPEPAAPIFPDVATKPYSWSRPATVSLLPQRFVFIGYRTGEPPLMHLGRPVPAKLVVSPDPLAPAEGQLRQDEHGDLLIPEPMRWLADFDEAVKVGMGLRIPLNAVQAAGGFDRVLVVGIRLGSDPQTSRAALEELFSGHARSRGGLSVLGQGTPTNNTEHGGSGHGRGDDPDDSFDRTTPKYTVTEDWSTKRDGQWLAEQLGVDRGYFAHTPGAERADQLTARAMNRALFPATLGYWMQSMLAHVFDASTVNHTRTFVHS